MNRKEHDPLIMSPAEKLERAMKRDLARIAELEAALKRERAKRRDTAQRALDLSHLYGRALLQAADAIDEYRAAYEAHVENEKKPEPLYSPLRRLTTARRELKEAAAHARALARTRPTEEDP